MYNRTWEDSVTVRFYKGFVYLKINSRNFEESSSALLNGFLIYPDGRSKRFTVSSGNDSSVQVPWSSSDYHLAFSGATTENEMAYSFGFSDKTNLADLSGTWSINEINAYEPNDSILTPYRVTDLSNPIKAYLKYGDIDFYTINCKEVEVTFKPVLIIANSIKEYENENNDNLATPGESLYLDVKMKNYSNSTLSGITLKLTTSSSYVNVIHDSYTLGDLKGGYYYSLTDYASSENSCYLMSSNYSDKTFKFSVASNCPSETEIPFTVSFTDGIGYTWTDSFSITVYKSQANIVLVTNAKYSVKEYENGNNNNQINPGESLYLDIKAKNSGKSTALGVTATLSSDSNYVTLIRNSYIIGDMKSGYYYSLTDYASSESSCYLMYSSFSSRAFKFSVSDTCPEGTELPFTVTFTDSSGNTWADTLSIPVSSSN